ncbi:hypothetical protein [Pseudoalteromonas luteoviolacea]|uniref:DUF304 domain-containing protein n=1 Tax=Pseudoalteromonas luteoviolacea S4054 TaxID=1129367 RepID=A0A0F6AE21_9GAMM|nr:hypothetical protein [Pseudoalteromonas luteoviolacea]AOT09009.1 hypothetical protein S4054249_14565 [Pseudoalteromonas luteoviolacea]AOT13921.1 hypothetical protein S40542_14535 [Pseudoalteromonas luteoviolacea]AOT18836.1 hypothetical protein S4054_14540 [Pseudoalteromonas luteoviolacea]KKE83644.1 hypothetical protein N479_01040 [Pseudoalteromonas luteoviolacea S4054]KZN63417.1 hypothetical protein N481_25635 [Pseudoalteromonas luteoviolacea S4047-1]
MKELRLQVNISFYILVLIVSLVLLSAAKLFLEMQLSQLATLQFIIAVSALFVALVHFMLTISGQKKVTICNQGFSYLNLFAKRQFIPSEEIQKLTTRNALGLRVIQIHTYEKTITLLAFKITKAQKRSLAQLGYLA